MPDTIPVHIRIDRDLKRWLWVRAAERGLRPGKVIEEAIRIMRETACGDGNESEAGS